MSHTKTSSTASDVRLADLSESESRAPAIDWRTWATDDLIRQVRIRRAELTGEPHDTIRIAIQLSVDEIIEEIDRRNNVVLDRRRGG